MSDPTAPRKKYALLKWSRKYNAANPAHRIATPHGFNPEAKAIGTPARDFVRLMQRATGLPVTGQFDEATMRRLLPPGIRGAVMAKAHGQLGVHEWPDGSNSGPVRKYLEAAGYPWAGPWCAAFVTWVLKMCGFRRLPANPASVESWLEFGQAHGLLKPVAKSLHGDLWIWAFGGNPHAHIGFADEGVKGGIAYFLDGNVGDHGGTVTDSERAAYQIHAVIDLVKLHNLKLARLQK